jgi:hypothetical protein
MGNLQQGVEDGPVGRFERMRPGNLNELRRFREALDIRDLPDGKTHSAQGLMRPVLGVKSRRHCSESARLVATDLLKNRIKTGRGEHPAQLVAIGRSGSGAIFLKCTAFLAWVKPPPPN